MIVSLTFAVKLTKYLHRMESIKVPKNQVDLQRSYSNDQVDNYASYSLNQGMSISEQSNEIGQDQEMMPMYNGKLSLEIFT